MFEGLTSRFSGAFSKLRSRGKLSASDINETFTEIRDALLDADVALEVVNDFVEVTQIKSLDLLKELQAGTNQAQAIFDLVNQELVSVLGGAARRIIISIRNVIIICVRIFCNPFISILYIPLAGIDQAINNRLTRLSSKGRL